MKYRRNYASVVTRDAADVAPVPTTFRARTTTTYVRTLLRWPTVTLRAALEMLDHVFPELIEY